MTERDNPKEAFAQECFDESLAASEEGKVKITFPNGMTFKVKINIGDIDGADTVFLSTVARLGFYDFERVIE